MISYEHASYILTKVNALCHCRECVICARVGFDFENGDPILRGPPQLRGFSLVFFSSQKPRKMGGILYNDVDKHTNLSDVIRYTS